MKSKKYTKKAYNFYKLINMFHHVYSNLFRITATGDDRITAIGDTRITANSDY